MVNIFETASMDAPNHSPSALWVAVVFPTVRFQEYLTNIYGQNIKVNRFRNG